MELKITTEQVLEAAKTCPQARSTLKIMFPEAFKTPYFNRLMGDKSPAARAVMALQLMNVAINIGSSHYAALGLKDLHPEERLEKMAELLIKGMKFDGLFREL